ncbi:MAG: hypothetical protein AAGK00_00430 [Pseudomonadota bacterium]
MTIRTRKSGRKPAQGAGPTLVLDFSTTAIRLLAVDQMGAIQGLGEVPLDDPDFRDRIEALRVEALVRTDANQPIALRLPPDQVVEHRLALSGNQAARRREASEKLAARLGYRPEDVLVAVGARDDSQSFPVLGALRQTADEAADYATRWGFVPGPVVSSITATGFDSALPTLSPAGPVAASVRRTTNKVLTGAICVALLAATALGTIKFGDDLIEAAVPVPERSGTIALARVVPADTWRSDWHTGDGPDQVRPPALVRHLQRMRTHPAAPKAVGIAAVAQVMAVPTPTVMTPPDAPARMSVGSAPSSVSHARPIKLVVSAPSTALARPKVLPVHVLADALNLAELPVPAAEPLADSPSDPSAARPDANPTARPVASLAMVVIAEAPADAAVDIQPVSGTADDEDTAPTEFAPTEMAVAPPDRPRRPGEPQNDSPADGSVETPTGSATDGPSEVVAAATAAPTASLSQGATLAAPAPQGSGAADMSAPGASLAAAIIDGSKEALEADPLAPTELAAEIAPPPPVRPEKLAARYLAQAEAEEIVRRRPISAGPQSLSVAAQQTGLALNETSLLGVLQGQNGRQALVRLPSGDFRKVARGDMLDGWRVTSIGTAAMRLSKQGQNRTLLLVNR